MTYLKHFMGASFVVALMVLVPSYGSSMAAGECVEADVKRDKAAHADDLAIYMDMYTGVPMSHETTQKRAANFLKFADKAKNIVGVDAKLLADFRFDMARLTDQVTGDSLFFNYDLRTLEITGLSCGPDGKPLLQPHWEQLMKQYETLNGQVKAGLLSKLMANK